MAACNVTGPSSLSYTLTDGVSKVLCSNCNGATFNSCPDIRCIGSKAFVLELQLPAGNFLLYSSPQGTFQACGGDNLEQFCLQCIDSGCGETPAGYIGPCANAPSASHRALNRVSVLHHRVCFRNQIEVPKPSSKAEF
jgi:hypothetical protein